MNSKVKGSKITFLTEQAEIESKIVKTMPPVKTLRILTLNMHKGFTVFNRSFVLHELRDAVRQVSADVVFLQEVHGSHTEHSLHHPKWPSTSQYEFLADSIWPEFAYGPNAVYPQGDHGNALLSKFPILRYQNINISLGKIEQRGLLHTVLQVPGYDEVHTVCLHLGLRESHRRHQLLSLCQLIETLPDNAPIIVAGDFNDWRKRADRILQAYGLEEVFKYTVGNHAKSFPARFPLLSLDRIYLKNATPKNPLTLTQRPWSHLSDHAPLFAEINL
jgi:endonuclease/exonuclease/phosphatase family metal-dependent hydrolase